MEDQKLKVGDEIVCIKSNGWHNYDSYCFKKIVRLTKTRAVTESGEQIENTLLKDWHGNFYYKQYGCENNWQIATPEIKEKALKEMKQRRINKWVKEQRFTDEQNTDIYNLFNKKPNE